MVVDLYPLSSAAHVPMLGRRAELAAIVARVGKASGDHVSVVGAPYIGKTTFLRHLANEVGPKNGRYLGAVFLDLRHGTPSTDHEFRLRFIKEVHQCLAAVGDDAAELIDLDSSQEDLPQVIEAGFTRVAVGGAVCRADDPPEAARELLAQLADARVPEH